MTAETLMKEFTTLAESEQKTFLDAVLSYLYDPASQLTEEEWNTELDRRVEAYENGEVTALNGKQVEMELEEKYGIQFRPAS